MPTIAKKIVAVAAVCAIAALSAQAESPVAAENGIRLSEWGNKPVLSELESSAPARKAEAESVLPELGEFLSEEWQTLGAGATDTDRLRKALANRATGRADDSLMSFMTSRWESAPGRLANFLTDHAETRLNAMPGIENAALDLTPGDDGNGFGFSASGVGMLHRDADSGFGLQPKIERSSEDGKLFGSFGAFQRKALGDWGVVGVNVFADYANDPVRGDASRFRVGADFSSAWVDADVRRHFGDNGREFYRDGNRFFAYTPDGLEAEMRVHSPGLAWLEGFAKFSEWEGRGANADSRSHSFGLTFIPTTMPALRANAEVDGSDAKMEVAYNLILGQEPVAVNAGNRFNVYSDIAKPVEDGQFQIEDFQLYEAAHLFEADHDSYGYRDACERLTDPVASRECYYSGWYHERERRTFESWNLVKPAYMRVTEHVRARCAPPLFSIWLTNTPADGNILAQHGSPGLIACDFLRKSLDPDMRVATDINAAVEEFRKTNAHMMYVMAADKANINAVKMLIIADVSKNGMGWWRGEVRSQTWNDTVLEAVGWRLNESEELNANPVRRERLIEIAKILRSNGFTCRQERVQRWSGILSEACTERDDDYPPFVRADYAVPEGSLNPAETKYVVEGYTGEVARISAVTPYADVDFFIKDSGDAFGYERAGRFRDSYTTCQEYENWLNRPGRLLVEAATISGCSESGYAIRTRINYGDGSKTAILNLTSEAVASKVYVITVTAKFFYHVNNLNTVEREVRITVLDKRAPVDAQLDIGSKTQVTRLPSIPELPDLVYFAPEGEPFSVLPNRRIYYSGKVGNGQVITLTVLATSSMLAGTLTVQVKLTGVCHVDSGYTPDGKNDILQAVVESNYNEFCTQVKANADWGHRNVANAAFGYGQMEESDIPIARALLALGLDARHRINSSSSPFSPSTRPINVAARGGGELIPMLEELALYGVGVNAADEHGNTPLMSAAEQHITDQRVFNYIMGLRPNLEIPETSTSDRALHKAANSTDGFRARALLDRGASINALDNESRTPLIRAVIAPVANVGMVSELVVADANLRLVDRDGFMAIHHAAAENNADIVCLLLGEDSTLTTARTTAYNSKYDADANSLPIDLAPEREDGGGDVRDALENSANNCR